MAATIDIIGKSGVKHSAVFEEASVRKFELMKEDYVRLVFSTSHKFTISLGDYIQIGQGFDPALRGRFEITKPQKPTFNATTGGYDYDLQFDAPHYKWNNKLFKFEPSTQRNEANWSLTDNLQNHMAVFLRNLEFYGWNYTVDNSSYAIESASRNIFIQYNNKYLLDALTQIAEAFECEWWITDNIIHFGKCETGSAVNFEVGVNVEDMGSEKSEREYITRLYGFGSDRNMPPDYRKNDEQVLMNGVVQKRVMLPEATPYVDIVNGLSDDEVVEGIVIFDDVYPHLDCEITDLQTDMREVKDESSDDENATITVPIYRFKSSSIEFLKDYILPGQNLQVQFQSGALNGMIFDLAFNPDGAAEKVNGDINPDSQWFEIVRNETYGLYLPNETLKPSKGGNGESPDRFVLLGWNVKKMQSGLGLVTAAENEVLSRTQAYAQKLHIDPNVYPCKMMSDYMYGLDRSGHQDSTFTKVGSFHLGQRIRLVNDNFFDGGSRNSRVIGFEYKMDKPYDSAIIYVGESATYSSKRDTEAKINEAMDAINYHGSNYTAYGGNSNIYIITTNEETAPSDANVYSALKTERIFARKDRDDNISSLWTFNPSAGQRRGIQSKEYQTYGAANEDNIFGKGFELVEKTVGGNRKTRLEVDELLVRVKAFFASLEIREISYVGGNYAFSAAGSKIYYVEWLGASDVVLTKTAANIPLVKKFRCYLYSDDGTTATENRWAVNDQALCETFNIDSTVHANTSNKRYWRRVLGVGKGIIPSLQETQPQAQEMASQQYQYLDLSNMVSTDYEAGSDYPEENDAIVQFGNWTNAARQGVIYFKVEGVGSPAIMEYSGVGVEHFTLPDPTLLLSPSKNVIYGEFHSVVDSQNGNAGSGATVEDQLAALIAQLNDIKNQADKKFDIWFGSGAPLPSKTSPSATPNSPASDWTTDSLKALHAQDIYYDTTRTPASTGGRAWRWVAVEDNGVVSYYWDEITDADTLASLEKIADVASDGVLTGGAEKIRVFIDWQRALSEHEEYFDRATDFNLPTEWADYHSAFVALANMLNNYSDLQKDSNGHYLTPAWFSNLYADTTIQSPATYRTTWNAYYNTLASLIDALHEKEKSLIDDIASDGIISGGSEKSELYKEWMRTKEEYFDYVARASAYGFDSFITAPNGSVLRGYYNDKVAFVRAFGALTTMLNGGTLGSGQRAVVVDSTNRTVLLANGEQLAWLKNLQQDTTIGSYTYLDDEENEVAYTADRYRLLWNNYYSASVKLLNDFTEYSKSLASKALVELGNIADDGILTPSEKLTVLREWDAAYNEYGKIIAQAAKTHVSSSAYTNAFYRLGNYLFDKTDSTTQRDVAYNTMSGSILVASGDTAISGSLFMTLWSNYYKERSDLVAAFSVSSVAYFVSASNNPPTPPFKVGDLWMQSDTNEMMVCTTALASGNNSYTVSDYWANMKDITEKRDPRLLIASLVNMVYSYNGGYIKEKTSNQYVNIYLGTIPSSANANGDMGYDSANDVVKRYEDSTWVVIDNELLRNVFKSVCGLTGNYTIRIFKFKPSFTPRLYDCICAQITFTDTNFPVGNANREVEGGIYIRMYNGTDWELLQESNHSIIENLPGYIRAVASAYANGAINTSGFITASDWATLFSQATDADGNILAQAHLGTFVTKVSDGNGGYKIQSGVKIDGDQVNVTAGDAISLAISSAVAGVKGYGPNLLPHSIINETSNVYGFGRRSLQLEAGKTYTLSVSGIVPTELPSNMVLKVFIFRYKDSTEVEGDNSKIGVDWSNDKQSLTITANGGAARIGSCQITPTKSGKFYILSYLYNTDSNEGGANEGTRTYPVTVLWYKVEEGSTATSWVPEESDNNSLENLVVNPLAVTGTKVSNDITTSEVTDDVFGKVLQISDNHPNDWQLKFTARDSIEQFTDENVTFYVICKNLNPDGALITESTGVISYPADFNFRHRYSGIVSGTSCRTSPFVDLGNGWRKYYFTKKITSGQGCEVGIHGMMGSWRIYAVGIVRGGVCPLVAEIMSMNALLKTGIDITTGKIQLDAYNSYITLDGRNSKITLSADNTDIKGSLNVYDENTGITLYDNSGAIKTQFVSRDISGLSNLNFQKSVVTGIRPNGSQVVITYILGTLESGRKLSISNQKIRQYIYSDSYSEQSFSGSVTLLNGNDEVVTTGTISNYSIPNTGTYKVQITVTRDSSSIFHIEWVFDVTVTGTSYVIIGRDGMLVANTNNRLFRVDDNGITLRKYNDAIFFENGGSTSTSLYRLGWNGTNEEKFPFDNYDNIVRLTGGEFSPLGHYDRDMNNGSSFSYQLLWNEAGTVIVKAGMYLVYKANLDLYLPSMAGKGPGYRIRIVHAARNSWATQNTGDYVHNLRIHTVDTNFPVFYNGNYYDNTTAGAYLTSMGVYEAVFTGVEWIIL